MPRRRVEPRFEISKALANLKTASFGDLLRETGLAEPTIARYLRHLEDAKLIISELSQKDRRKYIYTLNPEELAVISVREVIEAIKNELEEINEKLEQNEEEAIKKLLINHVRERVLDEYLKKEKYKREDALSFILNKLSSLISIKRGMSLIENNVGVVDKEKLASTLKEFAKAFERINPRIKLNVDRMVREMTDLIEFVDEIPITFAEKWMRTKYFEESGFASFVSQTLLGFMISPHITKLLEKNGF